MAGDLTERAGADDGTTAATTAMTAAADPTSCYPDPCRAVDDAQASALLGTPVAMPSGLCAHAAGGIATSRMPGQSQQLELGVITESRHGRCTVGDHDSAGMTLDIRVV